MRGTLQHFSTKKQGFPSLIDGTYPVSTRASACPGVLATCGIPSLVEAFENTQSRLCSEPVPKKKSKIVSVHSLIFTKG